MSHPTLSGFFPTQTYLVPFIFCTNLQINNWSIAFCWACLQCAEAFLSAAPRAHPSLVADPRACLRATQTQRRSCVWGEKSRGFGSREEKHQSRCLWVLQKGCVPMPGPPVTTATGVLDWPEPRKDPHASSADHLPPLLTTSASVLALPN